MPQVNNVNAQESSSSGVVSVSAARDNEFYFQDFLVIFRVGNTLFRVPKYAFDTHGTPFEAMFSLPNTEHVEGSTDENPIVLPVNEVHFRGFLRAVCSPRGRMLTNQDWLGALSLASMWNFEEVKKEAVRYLSASWIKSQSPKSLVLFAKKYCISSWLKYAYTQLTLQEIPFEDLMKPPDVGWETLAKLFIVKQQGRTQYRSDMGTICNKCGTGKICCGYVSPFVESTFKSELESFQNARVEEPVLPGISPGGDPDRSMKKKRKMELTETES